MEITDADNMLAESSFPKAATPSVSSSTNGFCDNPGSCNFGSIGKQ